MSASNARRLKLGLVSIGLVSLISGAIFGLGGATYLAVPPVDSGGITAIPSQLEYRNDKGESGNVEFRLRNEGTRAVRILSVQASCGCTQLEGEAFPPIEPGRDVTLTFRVSPPTYGSKKSIVKIRTDSSETPDVHVAVTLIGKNLTPPYVSRGPGDTRVQFLAGEIPAPLKLQLSCVESFGEPWLTGIEAHPALVAVDSPSLINETPLSEETISREYEVTLNFQPLADNSIHTIHLTPVTRTEPSKSFPSMSATWQQVDALRAAPSSLLFSFAVGDAAEHRTRRIVLVAADDAVWTIKSLTSDVSWFRAETANAGRESTNCQINVTCLTPDDQAASLEQGTLRIETDHPRSPVVQVRVSRVLRGT